MTIRSFARVTPEHLEDQLLYLQDGEFEPDDLYSGFNALVNDKIGEHIPEQDQMKEAILRKRKERARQFFRIWLIHSINITNLHSLMSFDRTPVLSIVTENSVGCGLPIAFGRISDTDFHDYKQAVYSGKQTPLTFIERMEENFY
ncbi:hypothetical protein RhiirA5_497380 [Rhizophagus irregularis]|uniref:Uncharacterized protein n=1 Tax=Rhizophagus irregularis TaxID=588596 RepID=A0A2N0PYC7_9GLOM|nr:hypothetical protein RhiirA5_497380 [Rhizophagus irregularis]